MNRAVARHAVVIILLRQGQVLLIQRATTLPRAGFWSPPTGKLEAGESYAQAVEREAMEELGLAVRALESLWQCDTDDGRFRLHWWLAAMNDADAEPTPAAAEVADWCWLAPQHFDSLSPTFPQHRQFFVELLPRWLNRQPASWPHSASVGRKAGGESG